MNGFINGEKLLSGNFYFYFFSQKIGASESVNQEIKLVWPYTAFVMHPYNLPHDIDTALPLVEIYNAIQQSG